jgi:hypothetical protein
MTAPLSLEPSLPLDSPVVPESPVVPVSTPLVPLEPSDEPSLDDVGVLEESSSDDAEVVSASVVPDDSTVPPLVDPDTVSALLESSPQPAIAAAARTIEARGDRREK